MKTYSLKVPVTIQEDGSSGLPASTQLEFKIGAPDGATPEQALQAFVLHLSSAAEITILGRDLPRSC